MDRQEELDQVKDIILTTIEEFELTFGEMCGMFDDLKFELWTELQNEEE